VFGNAISEYDATTGALIKINFIGGPMGYAMALDGNRLFVTDGFNESVGVYDATTGATLNAHLVSTPNANALTPALDANNHLFLSEVNFSQALPVREYDATTGTILNANFIPGPVTALLFMTPVPEPSSLLLMGFATAAMPILVCRRRRRRDF
jgi:hypothetical protein